MTTIALKGIVVFPSRPQVPEVRVLPEVAAGKGVGEMSSEEALIAGFLSRKPAAEAEFVKELQRQARVDVRNNFVSLWPQVRDIEQHVVLRACEMRDDPSLIARICPPLVALTKSLVDALARKLVRLRKSEQRLGTWDQAGPSNQEEANRLRELLTITAALPESMAKTILARAAEVSGDGPPLHEALGLDQRTADKRLARARAAVLRIGRGENPEEVLEGENE